jgi:transposase-like protein
MATKDIDEAPIWPDVTSLDKACLDCMVLLKQESDSMAGKLKKLTEEQAAQATKSYDEGMSLGDLAHIYYVTRQAMWDLIRRRTTLRDQKRYGKDNHFYRGGSRADARAHNLLEAAIGSGKLHNPCICSTCGSSEKFTDGRTAIQGHHDDYNKPLDVRWLCQKCHHEWHKNNKPIAYTGEPEVTEDVDIIFGGFP